MDLQTVTMDPAEAAERAKSYESLRMPTPEDRAIVAGLVALAAGKQLINLPETIRAGGEDELGLPRLAVMWADRPWCYVVRETSGTIEFEWDPYNRFDSRTRRFTFTDALTPRAHADLPDGATTGRLRSHVPPIPPEHRPGLSRLRKFAVLWEVEEWETDPTPPRDPALLRPLMGDLWSVEAIWDLTDLERAVLAGRR
jgi:hypothetical protein